MTNSKQNPTNRIYLAVFQFIIIIAFLIYWFNFNSKDKAANLWVLFFYCFPSEFLIGLLPHEPILIFFGKYYMPLVVATVSIAGTVLAEALNYSFFSIFAQKDYIQKIFKKPVVIRVFHLFNRAPFLLILIAGFTPVPFYPVRFLVVSTAYPLYKYLLAVLLSRFPRFYLLALLGFVFEIPNWLILVIFIVIIVVIYAQFASVFLKKK